MNDDEVFTFARRIEAPYGIVAQTMQMGRLPVVHFASGGIVTPADVGLVMLLGCDRVFAGGEVFNCSDLYNMVRATVQAVPHYNDPLVLAQGCSSYVDAMAALNHGKDSV